MLITEGGTKRVALVSMFAVLSTVLDIMVTPSISAGVWFGWIFVISPINGILLGPLDGFITTLISVFVGHSLVFRDSVYEYVFTLGAPICSMVTGLLARGEWGKVFLYYTVLIALYLLDPLSRILPLWGIWDVLFAYFVLIVLVILNRVNRYGSRFRQGFLIALFAFLGLEADVLFRIFILVPGHAYSVFYGLTPEALVFIWSVPAPIITPVKVAFSTVLTFFFVPRLKSTLQAHNFTT